MEQSNLLFSKLATSTPDLEVQKVNWQQNRDIYSIKQRQLYSDEIKYLADAKKS